MRSPPPSAPRNAARESESPETGMVPSRASCGPALLGGEERLRVVARAFGHLGRVGGAGDDADDVVDEAVLLRLPGVQVEVDAAGVADDLAERAAGSRRHDLV